MIDGTPTIVDEHGQWHESRMRRPRVETHDVMTTVRQRGRQRLEQVRYAIVERDGKVSITGAD